MAKNENKQKMTAEEVLNKSKKIEDRINVTFRLKESFVKDMDTMDPNYFSKRLHKTWKL